MRPRNACMHGQMANRFFFSLLSLSISCPLAALRIKAREWDREGLSCRGFTSRRLGSAACAPLLLGEIKSTGRGKVAAL